jgi:hypothetical protein
MLEPFWAQCKDTVGVLGDIFECDEAALATFAQGPCHHTNTMFNQATLDGSCPPNMLSSWVDDVNAACCLQNGRNECDSG